MLNFSVRYGRFEDAKTDTRVRRDIPMREWEDDDMPF